VTLTIGSLFSGIGGLELGLERAGLGPVIWQAESDPYARKVLAKHWPGVKVYEDVREIDERAERPDIICGGFPCQDISSAGAKVGIGGARSGLWAEYARIVRTLRPRYVVVENVSALLARGLGQVLGDLASSGYDAEWDCVPASAVGAPHQRDRVWIVGYPNRDRESVGPVDAEASRLPGVVADAALEPEREPADEAHAFAGSRKARPVIGRGGWWAVEPQVGRVADGVPSRVDRLKGLGNAVVPQIPEMIGHAILSSLHRETEGCEQ
jgi:DNA (cytosine-5)-methyltransferase 1